MTEAHIVPTSSIRAMLGTVWASRHRHAESWNAIGVFAVRAASAALLFVSQIVIARWMGAAEYGLFVTAWTCVLVLGGVVPLGFNTAMLRLAPQYFANKNYGAFHGGWIGGRRVATASATVVMLLGLAAVWFVETEGSAALALPLALAFLCLPLYTRTDVQDGVGRGQNWTMDSIVPPFVVRPLALLAMIGIAYVAGSPATAVTGMVLAFFSIVAANVLQTTLLKRRIRENVPDAAPIYDYAGWFKISLPLLAGGISEIVMLNADVLLLNLYRPPEEIGIYYAAAKTTALALFVLYAVGTAYAGRIAAASALGNRAEIETLVGQAVRWTFIPSAVVTLAILAAGYPVLASFGAGFTDAYPLMFILAAGILTKAAMGPSELILNMLGHQRASALSLGSAAILAVVLNLVLIPIWGVTGAAIATATAIISMSLMNWYAMRRLEGLNLFVLANLPRGKQQD